MNPETEPSDDGFADQLVAWDEALAEGRSHPASGDTPLSSESSEKLAKSLTCLKLLRRLHSPRARLSDTPILIPNLPTPLGPVPPIRLRPSIPRDLNTICLKCLEKEPHQRYESAQHLAEDLRRFLRDEPIQARPISVLESTWRRCRRHPLDTALVAALVLAVMVGVAGVFWQWRNAEQRRIETVDALAKVRDSHRDVVAQRDRSESMLYLHDIALAYHECLANNTDRANELLAKCRPELRNWEWYYLRQLCSTDLQTLEGHSLQVVSATFSPGGRHIASSSGKWGMHVPGEIKVWDAATGRELLTLAGHRGAVMEVAYHPQGKILAAAEQSWLNAESGSVKLWDTVSGHQLAQVANVGNAYSVAFNLTGNLLAIGEATPIVTICDATTGERQRSLRGHTGNVFSVAFHPDGVRLASGSRDGSARVWNTTTGAELLALKGLTDVRRVAFSPDGHLLAVSTFEGQLKICDANTGEEIAAHHSRPSGVESFSFSPDGRWLAVAQRFASVELWDRRSGKLVRRFPAHTAGAWHAAFSADGTRLVTAGKDGQVKVWDLTSDPEPRTLTIQESHIADVAVIPQGSLLAVASGPNHLSPARGTSDYRLRLWNSKLEKVTKTFPIEHAHWLTSVSASADGQWLATGSLDRTVRVWNANSGEAMPPFTGHLEPVTDVTFSTDGKRIVSASEDETLKVWDIATHREVRTLEGHDAPIRCVLWTPSGRVLSAGDDATIRLWDPGRETELDCRQVNDSPFVSLALSGDGRFVAAASADAVIRVWDLFSTSKDTLPANPVCSLQGHDGQITGLSFSADATRLASVCGDDDSVRLWDIQAGQEALHLPSIGKLNARVAFSPNGETLLIAAAQEIRIYHAPAELPSRDQRRQSAAERGGSWHLARATEAERERDSFGAIWHLDHLIKVNPEQMDLLVRRGNVYAEREQWLLADADFSRAIQSGKANAVWWYFKAMARLGMGDSRGYRAACHEMTSALEPTEEGNTANALAWTAVLQPPLDSELPRLVELANLAVKKAPSAYARYEAFSTLGLVLYRAGRTEEALDAMKMALQNYAGGQTWDWLLLAMIHHSLHHETDARLWFDKANKSLPKNPEYS